MTTITNIYAQPLEQCVLSAQTLLKEQPQTFEETNEKIAKMEKTFATLKNVLDKYRGIENQGTQIPIAEQNLNSLETCIHITKYDIAEAICLNPEIDNLFRTTLRNGTTEEQRQFLQTMNSTDEIALFGQAFLLEKSNALEAAQKYRALGSRQLETASSYPRSYSQVVSAAEQCFRRALLLDTSNNKIPLFKLGKAYLKAGNEEQAFRLFVEKSNREPGSLTEIVSEILQKANPSPQLQTLVEKQERINALYQDTLRGFSSDANQALSCFISYAWEKNVQSWIKSHLITDLRLASINQIFFDQFSLDLGQDANDYMDKIHDVSHVLLVCTPILKKKRDDWRNEIKSSGAARELTLINSRLDDIEKKGSFIALYYSGETTSSNPLPLTKSLIWASFTQKGIYREKLYQAAALNLIGSLSKISGEEKEQRIRQFKEGVAKIISE